MDNKMRAIGMKMSFLMGLTMSIILSLTGTLSSGHFTVLSWLISFGISFVISIIIGFIVPIKKVGDIVCNKVGVSPESMKGNLVSGMVSNLIYTPFITIVMVIVMVGNAAKHAPAGAVPPVSRVLPGSLIISLIIGYIVIIIVQPLYLKLLIRKNNK